MQSGVTNSKLITTPKLVKMNIHTLDPITLNDVTDLENAFMLSRVKAMAPSRFILSQITYTNPFGYWAS